MKEMYSQIQVYNCILLVHDPYKGYSSFYQTQYPRIVFFLYIHFIFNFCSSANVHPLVVAAHPLEPNQFAIGLTDGGVHVIEPLESEGKWGAAPPSENGSSSSLPTNAAQTPGASSSEQPQR
jgi:hypothetical protein